MLVVKKFGGTSVGNKDRIMTLQKDVLKITKKEMMLLLSYQQWVR